MTAINIIAAIAAAAILALAWAVMTGRIMPTNSAENMEDDE